MRRHDDVAQAKDGVRRAYQAAKGAGGIKVLQADRIWADTLSVTEGHSAGTRVAMFDRAAQLLTLLHDRTTWPRWQFNEAKPGL